MKMNNFLIDTSVAVDINLYFDGCQCDLHLALIQLNIYAFKI